MKTRLILLGIVATAGIVKAQWAGPGASNTTGNIYRSGNVGVGTSGAPAWKLDVLTNGGVDGIMVASPNTGGPDGAVIYLDAAAAGGNKYSIGSLGSGFSSPDNYAGDLDIYNQTSLKSALTIDGPTGNVGINTNAPSAQLHAISNNVAIIGQGAPAYLGSSTGVSGLAMGNGFTGIQTGVRGEAVGGTTNYSGYFRSYSGTAGVTTYGVRSEISAPWNGGTNYAIYGDVMIAHNTGAGPNWAGYFNGDVFTSATSYYSSDRTLKKEINKIENSLGTIRKLNPVNYTFDVEGNPSINLPSQNQYGFISQEIKEVLPEFTKIVIHPAKLDKNGKELSPSREILGLNYQGFIAILTKGIQEQQVQIEAQNKTIDDLQTHFAKLQKQMDGLTGNKTSNPTGINQINNPVDGFALEQNIPNPFSNETLVQYSLPAQIKSASMVVYDLTGKQLKSFPLENGSSSITITSESLSSGIYIYSIVADGKIMDSKRMVVADK